MAQLTFNARSNSRFSIFSMSVVVASAILLSLPANAQPHIVAQQVLLNGDQLATIQASPLNIATAPQPTNTPPFVISSEPLEIADVHASSSSLNALPDAPSAVLRGEAAEDNKFQTKAADNAHVASRYTKYIPSGWTAQSITAHDKVILGLRDIYSPLNFLGMLADAGYSQVTNGEPNYGTDRGAFGQRLGAAAIRETTEGLFTDSVFSPLLHQDPRYYVEGSQYSFIHRVLYAGTRPIITRNDSGKSAINASMLLGYAAASGLSYTYYPQINKNFHDTAATYGGSLGGAALGFLVSEFSDDLLKMVHLKSK
jgi:hypothetical protein